VSIDFAKNIEKFQKNLKIDLKTPEICKFEKKQLAKNREKSKLFMIFLTSAEKESIMVVSARKGTTPHRPRRRKNFPCTKQRRAHNVRAILQ
jgi:hypothetical protein